MSWFNKCKHEWEMLSEMVTESPFENAMRVSRESGDIGIKIPHQMCHTNRKVIQVVTCKKCGKLERYVNDIE